MANKLVNLLTRSNQDITEARANRIGRSVENSFKAVLMETQAKIDSLEDKKERMLDMSASNQTTTKNAVDDLEAEGFVREYCDIDEDLFVLKRQMKIRKAAYNDLMGEDVDLSVESIVGEDTPNQDPDSE
jgi:hypothetical protein